MTDKPTRTMMLTPHEWRALIFTGAQNIASCVNVLAADKAPDALQISWLFDALDRLKMQVAAWGASGQPMPESPRSVVQASDLQDLGMLSANGTGASVVAKKKRGWQKGRKRGPRQPKGEAVQ